MMRDSYGKAAPRGMTGSERLRGTPDVRRALPETASDAEWANRVRTLVQAAPRPTSQGRRLDAGAEIRGNAELRRDFNQWAAGHATPALRADLDADWRDSHFKPPGAVPTAQERAAHRVGWMRYQWEPGLRTYMRNMAVQATPLVIHPKRRAWPEWDAPMFTHPSYMRQRTDAMDFDHLLHAAQPSAKGIGPAMRYRSIYDDGSATVEAVKSALAQLTWALKARGLPQPRGLTSDPYDPYGPLDPGRGLTSDPTGGLDPPRPVRRDPARQGGGRRGIPGPPGYRRPLPNPYGPLDPGRGLTGDPYNGLPQPRPVRREPYGRRGY